MRDEDRARMRDERARAASKRRRRWEVLVTSLAIVAAAIGGVTFVSQEISAETARRAEDEARMKYPGYSHGGQAVYE